MLEHYNPSKHPNGNDLRHMVNGVDFFAKHRDMFQDCERSFTQFYYKRIPCSCLDEQWAALKSQSKTGMCNYCMQTKEYCALKDCSRCNWGQYCSKEFQVAGWPSHKVKCKLWRGKQFKCFLFCVCVMTRLMPH